MRFFQDLHDGLEETKNAIHVIFFGLAILLILPENMKSDLQPLLEPFIDPLYRIWFIILSTLVMSKALDLYVNNQNQNNRLENT